MAVVVARHGERFDYVDPEAFFASDEGKARPWDPRLTARGRAQARKLGERMAADLEARGLPRATKVFASPFVRTVETAEEVCGALGLDKIHVEHGVVEALSDPWFRSWAVPGADATWGGPPHCRDGIPVAPADLHPLAKQGPRAWVHTTEELKVVASPLVDVTYAPHHDLLSRTITWEEPETKAVQAQRCSQTVRGLGAKHAGETIVFLTHGGPAGELYKTLTSSPEKKPPGYTALYVYETGHAKGEHDALYKALLDGCNKHIEDM